jgi:exopolysaccharide production protein ExoQ
VMGMAATSSLEPVTVNMPWRFSLCLLTVFALTSPFDPTQPGKFGVTGLDELGQQLEKGSVQREVALLFLGVLALITFLNKKYWRLRINGLLGWLMLTYVAIALASPAWAEDPSLTIRRAGVLALLFLGALAMVARYSEIQIVALTVFTCSFTLIVSLAVEIAAGTFRPFDGTWRFSGVLHSVSQGWNCGLLAISSLALACVLPRRRGRLICLALTAFVFLGLTRSRMPLVSAIVASAFLGSLVSNRARKFAFASGYILLVCASLLWFVTFLVGGDAFAAAKNIAGMGRGEEASASLDTFTGRLPLWEQELAYARERPVLGYGYDAFLNAKNISAVSHAIGWTPTSPHSAYLGALVELGLVGAIVFAVVLFLALKRSIGLARRNPKAVFLAAAMVWLCCNLLLEAALITDPTFHCFLSITIITYLAFSKTLSPHAATPRQLIGVHS